MAKVFFRLPGYSEGIRARRIKQSGRLWLVPVVNDPDKREGGTFRPIGSLPSRDSIRQKTKPAAQPRLESGASVMKMRLSPSLPSWSRSIPPSPTRLPSPAQIAHRNKVQLRGVPKIHKELPGIPLSRASGPSEKPEEIDA